MGYIMKVFKRTSLYFLILLIILSAVSLFSACSNKGNVSQNDNISVGYVSVDNDISDIEITDD